MRKELNKQYADENGNIYTVTDVHKCDITANYIFSEDADRTIDPRQPDNYMPYKADWHEEEAENDGNEVCFEFDLFQLKDNETGKIIYVPQENLNDFNLIKYQVTRINDKNDCNAESDFWYYDNEDDAISKAEYEAKQNKAGIRFLVERIVDGESDTNYEEKNFEGHTHICDLCGKEITSSDFNQDNYFEANNQNCEGDYCDYRHKECEEQEDQGLYGNMPEEE